MKKGFTLIELLIVIAIIGILAGIVVGVTNRARISAATKATKASLSGLRAAIALCCAQNEGRLHDTVSNPSVDIDICTPAIKSYLPTKEQLNLSGTTAQVTYTLAADCSSTDPDAEPGYSVTLTGHPNSACNGAWEIRLTKFKPPTGCD